MAAYHRPLLIQNGAPALALDRIRLEVGADGKFSEKWLQRLLYENPGCLPIEDIDPSYGSIIPICQEINTKAGPADILYVTAHGKIVLVETKLYRNPEARRAVVAQIIDYAKELTKWRYGDLALEVAKVTGQGPNALIDIVQSRISAQGGLLNEAQFVDNINRSLSRADLLLLIVGDGITTGTEALIGFLEQYGTLHFSFGLIEAAVYRTPNDGYLIQPRILAKTEILRRTLLVGSDGSPVQEASVDEEEEQSIASVDPDARWRLDFWSDYLKLLPSRLDDQEQLLPKQTTTSTNVFLILPPGRNLCWISAYVSKSKNEVGVFLAFGAKYSRREEQFNRLNTEKETLEREIGAPLQWESSWRKEYIGTSTKFTSLDNLAERARLLEFLVEMTNRFVNTFKPRQEALEGS
jgi:hypothetical protein